MKSYSNRYIFIGFIFYATVSCNSEQKDTYKPQFHGDSATKLNAKDAEALQSIDGADGKKIEQGMDASLDIKESSSPVPEDGSNSGEDSKEDELVVLEPGITSPVKPRYCMDLESKMREFYSDSVMKGWNHQYEGAEPFKLTGIDDHYLVYKAVDGPIRKEHVDARDGGVTDANLLAGAAAVRKYITDRIKNVKPAQGVIVGKSDPDIYKETHTETINGTSWEAGWGRVWDSVEYDLGGMRFKIVYFYQGISLKTDEAPSGWGDGEISAIAWQNLESINECLSNL